MNARSTRNKETTRLQFSRLVFLIGVAAAKSMRFENETREQLQVVLDLLTANLTPGDLKAQWSWIDFAVMETSVNAAFLRPVKSRERFSLNSLAARTNRQGTSSRESLMPSRESDLIPFFGLSHKSFVRHQRVFGYIIHCHGHCALWPASKRRMIISRV